VRALIADDEPMARQVLRELLEEFPHVRVAGEATNGMEAVNQTERLDPDVVFLDIQMPGLDGFAVARNLRGARRPIVVFVSAFDRHALEAFEMDAADYLLKPVRHERLRAALDKVQSRLDLLPAHPPAAPEARPEEPRKIVGRLGAEYHMLNTDDVVAFQAEGEVVHILTGRGRFYAGHTLKALEERLPPPRFRRIHRSTIINTDHIRKISPLSSKRWLLKMSNGLEVIVSKRMAGAIRDATRW
jgi:two-component system, LytTR family, response regulator